jgi:aldehyde:ferredoxin oxidoreductase
MYGWCGKSIRVNLTSGSIQIDEYDPMEKKAYIGGRGWAIQILSEEMDPNTDPLSPENLLIMATGPLTGIHVPTGNRYMVVTKSPLSNALCRSNSGGFFPVEVKRAGYDLLIFEGRAPQPVYLWVKDDQIELRPAQHVWGKNVPETEAILLKETDPDARVALIGPAGERLVRFAAIMNDTHRNAARSGVGAVMGSKNLKAVVVRGTQKILAAQKELLQELNREVMGDITGDIRKGSNLRIYGTSYIPQITNELGILPTNNFQTGVFDGVDNISGQVLKERYFKKAKPCFECPLACGRGTEVVDPPEYQGAGEGPEYETLATLGSACGIDDMAAVLKANYLCNELGMDTISAGVTIACAIELYQRGYLPKEDVGTELKFGDGLLVLDLIRKMAYREGFGDLLAEGSYRLAEYYHHPELSMTSKKVELPGYDPRGAKGLGLVYATSNMGASHMNGHTGYPEVFGAPYRADPLTPEGKAALAKQFEDMFAVIDSSGLCVFVAVRYMVDRTEELRPSRIAELLNYATGSDYSEKSLLEAGERIYNLERLFLVRAGFDKKDDTLPERMLREGMPDGPAKGQVVELDQMLSEFYQLRGWDENGVPRPETLQYLGIKNFSTNNAEEVG